MGQLNFFSQDDFEFDGFPVDVVRRPYQRNLSVSVRPSGIVRVSANQSVRQKYIVNFLEENRDWILQNQHYFCNLRRRYPEKKYVPGELFLYRGGQYHLHYAEGSGSIRISGENLVVNVGQSAARDKVRGFYRLEGRKTLEARVQYYSKEMGLYPSALSFRSQKTRWGSCSSDGHVSLNWRLVAASPEILDYVVVHELAHLKHQNHSAQFWSFVARYCPSYKDDRKWLKQNQYAFDFLAKRSELYSLGE